MKNYREAGKTLFDFFENVEAELGLLTGLELVCAVAGADSDCKRVNAGPFHEFLNLIGIGVGSILGGNVDGIFDTGKTAEFAFDNYAVIVSIFNDLLGKFDVFFEREVGAVDHNGGEAAVDAGFAELEGIAVVEMETYGKPGILDSGFNELYKIGVLGILSCAGGNLKDKGGIFFLCGFRDALDDLHIVDIEGADGITALIGFFEHFFCCYERHGSNSFSLLCFLLLSLAFFGAFVNMNL